MIYLRRIFKRHYHIRDTGHPLTDVFRQNALEAFWFDWRYHGWRVAVDNFRAIVFEGW